MTTKAAEKTATDHTTNNPQKLVHKVIMYAFNFQYQFYKKIAWTTNTQHMANKWGNCCARENNQTHAGFIRFYTELDGENRNRLITYINQTYRG